MPFQVVTVSTSRKETHSSKMHLIKSWTKEDISKIKTVHYCGATGSVVCNYYSVRVNWGTHIGEYTYDRFRKLLQEGSLACNA